ncbi:PAS domain-containing sensor histidine kinase [Actinoplanes sp. NEAU-A12]|uniref:Sensor-like histidine kinase SenX3 n=1 Tax=Actinoplanes sandaracinus TaxID=3045177 RepID=A0ABT6WJK3_9ACTN|nr:PAS domain-containing sensor histidine kinase [Actinoplanes sandaracinus]MDI6099908.1 PAS domain-containing sensor histidine kinase [Actinoplanes sandaracinus]
MGRLSRLAAGCAGVMVAVFGILHTFDAGSAPEDPRGTPAMALIPAGLALLLQVVPVSGVPAGRLRAGTAAFLALSATGAAATALGGAPATAVATALAGLALACLDLRVPRRSGGIAFRVADPLLLGAAIIALVALVPQLFEPAFPPGRGPDSVMPPHLAGALLCLATGTILARPETGPLHTLDDSGPRAAVRRLAPALIAAPIVAALVSAFAARTGVSRPVAAVSTGVILAALALLALLAYLVRTLDDADQRQRHLVAELRERQDFAQTLLQSMNEAVMVLDANYRVIDVNRRWRELTGHDGLPAESPPLPPPGTGGDWLLPRADGTDVPVLATMAAIPDATGTTRGYVATYIDIAERKQAEVALTEHAADLERGNADLAAALAFKNDLTSMLTHDVAQPISSIASLAELLCADWADLPDDIRLELATKIDKNTRRLIKMMNDLQLLFRLDTGTVTARRVPVPLLEVVEAACGTAVDTADVKIVIDEELAALADRGHLTVVVENLLKNAMTHGAPPIHIQAGREAGGTVRLTVQDSGAGIPEDVLPSLFGRFIRGAGLGLFIVRHLIEANGGSVSYEHAEPRGARLLVTLEAAPN